MVGGMYDGGMSGGGRAWQGGMFIRGHAWQGQVCMAGRWYGIHAPPGGQNS